MEAELEDRLREVGSRLASPPFAVDELLQLLDHAESLLSRVDQSPKYSMSTALRPSMKALVSNELLGHSDLDVKVAALSCLSEITRITAPELPYEDELMKELFQKIVEVFENLDDISGRSHPKRVSILETLAKVRSCVVMLDLGCDSDILEMFRHFFKTIRPNHSEMIFSSMETVMTLVIEENEDISSELLLCLLDSVKRDNNKILPIVRKLGEKVISNCAGKLKPYLVDLSESVGTSLNEYGEVVASICQQNSHALEQNGLNIIMGDDSKRSERTVSDKMLQGTDDVGQEVGRPVELTPIKKSPEPAMSNGNVQMGNGVSTPEPSSPKHKSEPSPSHDQYEKPAAADRDASDSGSVKDSLPAEPEVPNANQPKQSRARGNGRDAACEQSASSLQDKQSETGDQAFSSQKESDDTGDSGRIVDPARVVISSEEKSQSQRFRKGSLSKTEHRSSQRSQTSKTKQPNLKAKNDGVGEPILKISETSKELDGSLVGCRIRVWWPIDKKFYDGKIDSYNQSSKKHKIIYNDGDVEILMLKKERWEFTGDDNESGKKQAGGSGRPDAVSEEPKSKWRKASPSSISDETKTETAAKRRRGRPPRAALASPDDNPSSSGKVNEKADEETRDENAMSESHIADDPKSKDDVSKGRSSSKGGGELKDSSSKGAKEALKRKNNTDESPRTGKKSRGSTAPKADCASDAIPRRGRKPKGATTAKTGSGSKLATASEKGKAAKTAGSEEANKSAGRRRKRKG